jgi:hypothetical protein
MIKGMLSSQENEIFNMFTNDLEFLHCFEKDTPYWWV